MNWNKTVKTQMLAAGTMTLLGICVCAYSQSYLSAYDITEITEKYEDAYLPAPVNMRQATPETAVKEEPLGFQASLTAFNLAFLYQDANGSSLGTKLVEAFSKMESDWLSSIYELAVSRPESLAASLGMEPSSYQNVSWNKVEITFYDENNNLITAKSNIQEIISMANTYFYYSAPEDYDSFLEYCSKLFEGSHSVRYSISDVYYCDGSLEQEVSEDDDDLSEDLVQSKEEATSGNGGLNGGPGVPRSAAEGEESASGAVGSTAQNNSGPAVKASEIPAVTDPSASLEGAVSTEAGGNGASGNAGEAEGAAVTSAAASDMSLSVSKAVETATEAAVKAAVPETDAGESAASAGLKEGEGSGEIPGSAKGLPESAGTAAAGNGAEASGQSLAGGQDALGAESNSAASNGSGDKTAVSVTAAAASEGGNSAGADGNSQAVQSAQAGGQTAQTMQAGDQAAQSTQAGDQTAQTMQAINQAAQTVQAGEPAQNSAGAETKSMYQEKTEQAFGETGEIGPGIALRESKASKAALETGAVTETSEPVEESCPGHTDLHITAVISGLSNSEKGLFLLDSVGKKEAEKGSWMGWTDENKNYALQLAAQNWEEIYGFTMSPAFIMSPLSSEEINGYMKGLPENISEDRKVLIRYALSSVGRVPYYWGGKPATSGYDGNHFGSLITPDRKGRSMKGLDCSGWINWVYWSALEKRLPCQGTGGLSSCGTAVKREDLQPGDIILKTGSEAHVVMFLRWEEDGTMKVIHESSAAVNNVTISAMTAQWPYYRKLID